MPIIKRVVVPESQVLTIKLEVDLIETLREYTLYTNQSQSYIVSEALKYAINSDKEFTAKKQVLIKGAGK